MGDGPRVIKGLRGIHLKYKGNESSVDSFVHSPSRSAFLDNIEKVQSDGLEER